jgi:sugar phosphate isomerase/epimerase
MGLEKMHRRDFCSRLVGLAAAGLSPATLQMNGPALRLRYIVASSMYGRMKLADVLPEVRKAGAEHIDIWPEPHASHREQIEAMGHQQFAAMLRQHEVKLGILTHYDLGPFGLQDEMGIAKRLGGSLVICGSQGPSNLKGDALKAAIRKFLDQMKPHIGAAEQMGVTIGIENHANSLIQSPDSMRWFAELGCSKCIGIALAPYHLPQDPALIAQLVTDLGEHLVHFYAWQYGQGCQKKLPKEQELLQLPGRGELDFVPIIDALKEMNYKGWTEVFMHPVPRGDPIMPTASAVTAEIDRARSYLEGCLTKVL